MSAAPIPKTAPFPDEEIELLNRVVGSASATQRAWLAGFLAGLEASAAAPQPAAAALPAEPLTILYATESGNAEKLAADMAKAARKSGLKPALVDMADLDLSTLASARRLVVIASTWGEGEPPGRAARAYAELMGERAPRLDGVEYGVLALGDTAYAQFCAIGRALDELGFPPETLIDLPTDDRFRLHAEPVADAIAADRDAGLTPIAISAVAGSTNTGSVDRLEELADLAARENLWFHVDAAYGAAARLSARDADRVAGLERADSITVDPHKWFYQAYDIGGLVVRDGSLLERTFGSRRPEYYRGGEAPTGKGAAARFSARDADRVAGLERADSITVDPHKWFYQAYDIGGLVVRQGSLLERTFGSRRPEYYRGGEAVTGKVPDGDADAHDDHDTPGQLNFYKLGFEGTRRWRALKLWMSWKHVGTNGFGRLVAGNIDQAALLAQRCAESDDLEALPAEPELSVVCFRHLPGGSDAAGRPPATDLDDHQDRLQAALEKSGDGWLSTTRLRGSTWLRAGIVNTQTTEADIDALLTTLRRLANELP